MKRSLWNFVLGCTYAAMAATTGCTPSNTVPGGAPLLVKFVVVDPTGAAFDLATDAGMPILVPPRSTFYSLFDRLLDPTSLETIDPDGGANVPNRGVAVIDWSGGSVDAHTLYVPNGDHKLTLLPEAFSLPFANGPSITISPDSGLPSGSRVTVALDPGKVRSHDQTTAFKVDDTVAYPLIFDTEPLSVTVDVPQPEIPEAGSDDAAADDAGTGDGGTGTNPAPAVDTTYVAHVLFNNLTDDVTKDQILVTGMAGTAAIANLGAVVARDEMAPAGWTVSPPPDGWPPGAVITITVTKDAVDNFGVKLATAVTTTFTVKVGP